MAKWVLMRRGAGPFQYPDLGFSANSGDVLEADEAPDSYWSPTDGGAPETVDRLGGGGGAIEPSAILYYQAGIGRFSVDQPAPSGQFTYVDWTESDSLYNEDSDDPVLSIDGNGDVVVNKAGFYGITPSLSYIHTGVGTAENYFVGVGVVSNGSVIAEMRGYPNGVAADVTINSAFISRKMFGGASNPFIPIEQIIETTVALSEGQVLRFRTNFGVDGLAQAGSCDFGFDMRAIAYI